MGRLTLSKSTARDSFSPPIPEISKIGDLRRSRRSGEDIIIGHFVSFWAKNLTLNEFWQINVFWRNNPTILQPSQRDDILLFLWNIWHMDVWNILWSGYDIIMIFSQTQSKRTKSVYKHPQHSLRPHASVFLTPFWKCTNLWHGMFLYIRRVVLPPFRPKWSFWRGGKTTQIPVFVGEGDWFTVNN